MGSPEEQEKCNNWHHGYQQVRAPRYDYRLQFLYLMQIILRDAIREFGAKKKGCDDKQIEAFVKSHPYYDEALPLPSIITNLRSNITHNNDQNCLIETKLHQLSLYLKKDTNRLMFEIYEFILRNPKGITYKEIEKKTKLEIVNISHYCCRLRKMNFVELKHDKSEKVVKPKEGPVGKFEEEEENESHPPRPFFFHELTIVDNIWVNVSSVDSLENNGITNEEIKEKLNKPSETKLIMKLMDQVKEMFNFEREMVSEGKVFEHKYRNVTEKVKDIVNSEKPESEVSEKLSPKIENWLERKFPGFGGDNFLLNFINKELKSYFSVSGTKTARRACTPIKLVRYIRILNSLNEKWPQTHNELKRYIIEEEKDIPNNGIMHKRSIVGILGGLIEKGILKKEEDYYFPLWDPDGVEIPIHAREIKDLPESRPRKKIHLASLNNDIPETKGTIILQKDYQKELKARLLVEEFESMMKVRIRTAFKRIIYARRNKMDFQPYEPQNHILHLIDSPSAHFPSLNTQSYDSFLGDLDQFIELNGIKEEPINVGNDMMKIFRKYPFRNEDHFRAKYGKNWREKLSPLHDCVVEGDEIAVREDCHRFFI